MIEQQKIIVNQLMNATGNDGERWKTTAGDIGARMARVLEQEELACEEMRARVVDPLVQFFNEDIQYAQDLKTQYKVAKSDYESALGAFEKAKAANKDSVKIESTEKKCAEQRAALETIKQQFKECVRILIAKKNSSLNQTIEDFRRIYGEGYRQCAALSV